MMFDRRFLVTITCITFLTVLVTISLILQDVPLVIVFNNKVSSKLPQQTNVKLNWTVNLFAKHCNKTNGSRNFITIKEARGRLGNVLFQFLSLLGVAMDRCAIPVIHKQFAQHLDSVFDLSFIQIIPEIPENWRTFNEEYSGTIYSPGVQRLDHNNWTLDGYFQSWRYFDRYKDAILSKLTFKEDISKQIDIYLHETKEFINKTTICVHNRRGDFLRPDHRAVGFSSADLGYLRKSMDYFTNRLKNQSLVFIILSDDIKWCKDNIQGPNVHYSPFSSAKGDNSAGLDMALMSKCDHSIVTSGSFGWIGAWLGQGEVVYFKGFPVLGSPKDKRMNRSDYYPPHWKGMM